MNTNPHINALKILFPKIALLDDYVIIDKLLTLEQRAHYLNNQWCSGTISEQAMERREKSIRRRVEEFLGKPADGVSIYYNGDPRGYALKLKISNNAPEHIKDAYNQCHRDWGNYAIIAPEELKEI